MSGFDPVGPGANPGEAAIRMQNDELRMKNSLPLSVEVCTPVSETGRTGALPVAAATSIYDLRDRSDVEQRIFSKRFIRF
jgi:hypothetical protein